MPHIKNALIRYRVIDKALSNTYNPYPTKLDLRYACEMELYGDTNGKHISDSTIEKDLYAMRQELDAPIKYSKRYKGYYYEDPNFTINEKPLSEDDIASIQFALSTLSQFKETEMFQQFGFALNKIIDRVNLDSDSRGKNTDIDQYIQFEKSTVAKGNEYLKSLNNKVKNLQILNLNCFLGTLLESLLLLMLDRKKLCSLLPLLHRNILILNLFMKVKKY